MINISYTISPFLLRYGEKLEHLRRSVLLSIISPKEELSLQFEATISRIYYMLKMDQETITREEIKQIIANQMHFTSQTKSKITRQNPIHTRILRYKSGYDYIQREWLVSNNTVTVKDLIILHELLSPGKLRVSEKQVQEVLDYIQAPATFYITQRASTPIAFDAIIQAAIAKLTFNALEPFTENNAAFSTLASYLFLYKAGLNYRGLLVLEETWAKNMLVYNGQYKTALKKTNITNWLEYFLRSVNTQLDEMSQNVTKDVKKHPNVSEKTSELNNRQKEILNLFNDPASTITNRDIQKIFKISQITASRDLAKLVTLNLLFTHGKGRSVRYTKV